jgi:hypothetical protein
MEDFGRPADGVVEHSLEGPLSTSSAGTRSLTFAERTAYPGNGIVCDERVGPAGAPISVSIPKRTRDDVPLPTAPAAMLSRSPAP